MEWIHNLSRKKKKYGKGWNILPMKRNVKLLAIGVQYCHLLMWQEDNESIKQHLNALREEMTKTKPHKNHPTTHEIDFFKMAFHKSWCHLCHGDTYPTLKIPTIVRIIYYYYVNVYYFRNKKWT